MSRYDVVVIGAGLAGTAAALEARRRGASTLMLAAQPGATALAGGTWDVAPLPMLSRQEMVAPRQSIASAVLAFAEAHPFHPYVRVHGDLLGNLRTSHEELFRSLGLYRPITWEGGGELVATDLGLVRRTSTSQYPVLPMDSFVNDASFVLEDDSPSVRARVQALASAFPAEARPRIMATRVLGSHEPPARARLVAPDVRRSNLERRNDGSLVGEWAATMAGPQSARLDLALSRSLSALAVQKEKVAATRVSWRDAHSLHISLANGSTLEARSVVLSSGKFLGGGVAADGGTFVEPLAGVPLYADGAPLKLPASAFGHDPTTLYGVRPFVSESGHRIGVGYDGSLRVLSTNGGPAHPRLFAAGAILSGFDPARDGTGFGTCAMTGWLAGAYATTA